LEDPRAAILFVRITSGLDADEFDRRLLQRRPRFRDMPGLVQKIYGRDHATGDVCGIYFFDSDEALAAFPETELARTIPDAYGAIDVRREAYDVLYALWPKRDRSPSSIAPQRHPLTARRACVSSPPRRPRSGGVRRASAVIGVDRALPKDESEGLNYVRARILRFIAAARSPACRDRCSSSVRGRGGT
jgi:hypothetical protein